MGLETVIPETVMPQEPRLQRGFGRLRNLSSDVLITCTPSLLVYLVGAWPRERNQVGFGLANYKTLSGKSCDLCEYGLPTFNS